MSYFLSADKLELSKAIEIIGDEARHILFARRIKVGEKIVLQGPDEKRFLCEVIGFTKKSISIKTIEEIDVPAEPVLKITLFQALISEQALDYILQKSTELGVSNIVIFNAKNTPAHLKEKVESKLLRWQKIAQEAAKQSNRVRPPVVSFLESINDVIALFNDLDKIFLLEKTSQQSFKDNQASSSIGILVGPEGGFAKEELGSFDLSKITKVRVGPRILRADTAAVTAAAIAQSLWGDM